MSSDADADAAAVVASFDGFLIEGYCQVAAAVLFIYDACLTFDQEVACFWTTQRTGAALLFFANKWINTTYYVLMLVAFASFPSDKFLPGAAFSALRAYVLSRSKPVGLLVFALSLVPLGANLVPYGYQPAGEKVPPWGCLETDNTTAALDLRLIILSRASLIAADTLLVYITWTKMRGWAALSDIRQSKVLSLSGIVFRGGIIYFAVLFGLNALHLTLSVNAVAGNNQGSYITEFTGSITAILISRFLLELQEANQTVVRLNPDDPLQTSRNPWDSTPSFISSIGGFVNPAQSVRSDQDEDFQLQVRSLSESCEVEDGKEGRIEAPRSPQDAASLSSV